MSTINISFEDMKQLEEEIEQRVIARLNIQHKVSPNGYTGPLGEVRKKYAKNSWDGCKTIYGPLAENFGPHKSHRLWEGINKVAKAMIGISRITELTYESEVAYAAIVEELCEYAIDYKRQETK